MALFRASSARASGKTVDWKKTVFPTTWGSAMPGPNAVTCFASPPAMSRRHSWEPSSRLERKVKDRPSADQRGQVSDVPAKVSCRTAPLRRSAIHTWVARVDFRRSWEATSKRSREPSGERARWATSLRR